MKKKKKTNKTKLFEIAKGALTRAFFAVFKYC